jgi:hypothetical protein
MSSSSVPIGPVITEARNKARLASILEGADARAADQGISAYLVSAAPILMPEPDNRPDRNAVGVWLRLLGAEADEQAD